MPCRAAFTPSLGRGAFLGRRPVRLVALKGDTRGSSSMISCRSSTADRGQTGSAAIRRQVPALLSHCCNIHFVAARPFGHRAHIS